MTVVKKKKFFARAKVIDISERLSETLNLFLLKFHSKFERVLFNFLNFHKVVEWLKLLASSFHLGALELLLARGFARLTEREFFSFFVSGNKPTELPLEEGGCDGAARRLLPKAPSRPCAAQTHVYQSGIRLINEADCLTEMSPSVNVCSVTSRRR